jgi:hypothetical protein
MFGGREEEEEELVLPGWVAGDEGQGSEDERGSPVRQGVRNANF